MQEAATGRSFTVVNRDQRHQQRTSDTTGQRQPSNGPRHGRRDRERVSREPQGDPGQLCVASGSEGFRQSGGGTQAQR